MKRTLEHGVEAFEDIHPLLPYYNCPAADCLIRTLGWTPDQLRTIADDIERREREDKQ